MTWDQFRALPWKEQNALLEPVIRDVLKGHAKPLDSRELALTLAYRFGWPQHDVVIGKLLGFLLRRFAPHSDFATHDGARFHAMGREMRRWRWHLPKDRAEPEEIDLFS